MPELSTVNSKAAIRAFHKVPFLIYRNDPHWIPHLKQDVESVFNPKQNKFFRHGEIIRWILRDDAGKPIGRVAAFIDNKTAKTFQQPTGSMGFFECIEDKQAAFTLFDACRNWLEARGMKAMDGPINFGEKDKFWGLITENFDAPPYYGQNYNPAYYVRFFEEYGFKIYYNQLIYSRRVYDPLQEKYVERAERIFSDPRYKACTIEKRNLAKYAEDFRTVYNRAWSTHDNFKGMSKIQAMAIMKKMKPIVDVDLVWFVYYENKPVAFFIQLPELNEIFRHVNGNLNWWGKIKFLFYQKTRSPKTSFGVAFGVDPDFQGKGIEGAIFRSLEQRIIPKKKYFRLIITWIGDFNPKMIRIIENLGCTLYRKMATYRCIFDPDIPFQRSPIIGKKGKD